MYRGEYLKELIFCCLLILLFISLGVVLKLVYRFLLKKYRIIQIIMIRIMYKEI